MRRNQQDTQRLPSESLLPLMADHPPNRRPDVRMREVAGETIIFDCQGGLIHQLNRTASYIWDRCDGHSTLADITHHVVEAFDVDAETAAAEVAAIIRQFHQLNLLEPREGVAMHREPADGGKVNHV